MTTKSKILFIGIDAADKDLILQWAKAGLLPTFQSLLEKGAWGITTNPVGLYVGAIWPSFATGISPARHGCYSFSQLAPGTYRTTSYSVFDLKGELFWDVLSRAGRRVAILDVPRTPPSVDLNGIQIVDWGTHDPDLPDTLYTWPRSLAGEVEARFGRDPIGYCNRVTRTADGLKKFRDDLVTRTEKKAELSSYFLEQGGWDLFMTVFAESHCVGHQCWNLNDPTHPKHNPAIVNAIGNPIKDVYIAIDAAIGRLLNQVDPETTVFVLASHGMGPHYDGTFMLDEILCRLEKVKPPTMRRQVAKVLNSSWEQTPVLQGFLKPLRKYVWQPLRNRFWKIDKPVREALQEPDAAGRKCFTLPNNDVYGGIRVNLVGREPNGKIRPGAEYEAFCQELTQDLMALVNVDTGKPLVQKVLRTAECYQGEYLDHLPDLMVEWNREAPISSVYSPKTGKIEKEFQGVRTGDHKAEGIMFAIGPSIQPGKIEQPISVMDFAPTIASLLEVPLPEVDGKAIALSSV
ncbi:alkaline phosphatase family protein [Coleofasciculus sp. H7-2]|uniref:alkaline phosphatase family protein n=1 Tax=Coleofasciculus sp. H7-2 TaxID=3351545 RepID=UPI0036730E8A